MVNFPDKGYAAISFPFKSLVCPPTKTPLSLQGILTISL